MGELRCRQTQKPIQIELPRRRGKQVGPAHDFGDTHPGVVHHDGQLIRKYAVGAAEVKVTAVAQKVFCMFAHTAVGEGDVLVRHHEAVSRGFLFPLFGDFFGCQPPAGAGIDDVAVRGVGRTGGMELAAGAEAGIDKPHVFQLFVALGVDAAALALVIWLMGAALAAALIPEKAQPPKVFFQLVGVLAGAALRVQILDAENDSPAPALGAQPCKEAAREVAQMEPPAGAGGEPPDDSAHRPSFHSPSFGWKMGVL